MIAKDIMSTNVVTIKKDLTIEQIAKVLTEKNISGVPVVDENDKIIGIVTKKDLIYKDLEPRFPSYIEVLGGIFFINGVKHYEEELKKLVATKAEDIMTNKVVTITEDEDVKTIAELMVEKSINRLPVVKDGKIIGIVSRGDLVKSLIN